MKVGERTNEQCQLLAYYRHYADDFIYVSVEHYQRCGFRCLYCITESQGKTKPTLPDMASFREQLARELDAFDGERYMFCVSGATDPYNELEEQYGYTRHLIEELIRRDRRFSITTKSPLILRDLDLLQRLPRSGRHKFIMSISASEHERTQRLEPQAPPPEQRIEAVHRLHEAGLHTCVLLSPWIPEVTDTDRLLSLLPKGIAVFVQPLDLGHDFSETLDNRRPRFSSDAALGKHWTQNEINRAYIAECNTVGKKYRDDFEMEWRLPITKETHEDNSGYLKKLRPGKFDPDQWVAEHFIQPRIPAKEQEH